MQFVLRNFIFDVFSYHIRFYVDIFGGMLVWNETEYSSQTFTAVNEEDKVIFFCHIYQLTALFIFIFILGCCCCLYIWWTGLPKIVYQKHNEEANQSGSLINYKICPNKYTWFLALVFVWLEMKHITVYRLPLQLMRQIMRVHRFVLFSYSLTLFSLGMLILIK